MECLSPEVMARYLRGGGNGESRVVEAHVRDCPACAMHLLLARETLCELKAKAVRPATERHRLPRRGRRSWVPWTAAAAAVLFAILAFALRPSPPVRRDSGIAKPPPVPVVPKQDVVVVPDKPVEGPKKPELPPPPPEPPKPLPDPKPAPPVPKPDPKPQPEPVKPPEPPKPAPEPTKPAPTVVGRTAVARVTHTVGPTPVGKTIFAGDTLATGQREFVAVSLDGYGSLYFRENSKAEIGANGEINLVDGEMFGKIDSGRRLGALKTPAAEVELQAAMFDIQVTKTQTEISVVDGRAAVGSVAAKGPSALVAKAGKAAEVRPLDPGFASWIPAPLATKSFAGWYEGESFSALQGFKAMEYAQSSGGRAAVQVAEQGTVVLKSALPFRGPHAVWVRVRQHPAKATLIGAQLNGQSRGEEKLGGAEGKPAWRWVAFVLNSDRLELAIAALSRYPLSASERNSFPVVIDAVWVTTDLKAQPPERLAEERRAFDLVLDEPAK